MITLLLVCANHTELLQIPKCAMLSQVFLSLCLLMFFLLSGVIIIPLIVWKFLVFQDSAQISLCAKILPDHFLSQVKLLVFSLISPIHLYKPKRFIPKNLMFLNDIENGNNFLSFSNYSLLVYRNAVDLCMYIIPVSSDLAKFTY